MERIATAVALYYGVPYFKLFLKTKKREVIIARQMAIFITCKTMPYLTLAEIGRFYIKDHTTVIHSRNVIDKEIQVNKVREKERKEIVATLLPGSSLEVDNSLIIFCRPNKYDIKKSK